MTAVSPQASVEAQERRADSLLRGIIVLYLLLGALYATVTPAWQVPDEPAHYNYVRDIAERGTLPELKPGDYPAAYLEEIKARRFPPDMSIDPIRYEAHQPPLYYILGAVVYRLSGALPGLPPVIALRALSVLLGAAALVAAYRLVRTILPASPRLALATAALVATLPMHLAMTAGVNNDVLTELLLNVIAWQVIAMRPGDWGARRAFALGALLGLAFLTKMQSYVAFAVVLAALAWDAWRPRAAALRLAPWRGLGLAGIILGTSLLLALPWLSRNMAFYGPADPLGMARHDQVVQGQLTTAAFVAAHGPLALIRDFARTTFQSFWGQFGWMGVVLPQPIYLALAMISGLAGIGFVGAAIGRLRQGPLPPQVARGVFLLAVWVLVTALGYLWWNTKYVQHQGRYLFPSLAPLSLAMAVGLREVIARPPRWLFGLLGAGLVILILLSILSADVKGLGLALVIGAGLALWAGRWVERRYPGLAQATLYAALAALSVLCLYAYILPALRP